MKMEHTSLQKIGRHLLNMAENEVEPLAVTTQSLVLQAVGAVLAVTTLVVVLALCVCKEKEQMSTQEVQLTSRTPLGERKSRGESVANEETKPVPSEEIKVENEVDKRQSNGSVASGRERPKSHDRALPDIPVVTADPQDPEEDGNYSVITNRANGASNLPQAKEGKKSDHKNRHHPYEKVDGFLTPPGGSSEDTDDGYAGVGGNNPYPYAVVTDVGNAEYAKVEKGQTREPPGVKPENKIAVPDITYASVTSPPVPEKRFSNNEEPENSGSRVSAAGGHSPDLPPRNSMPGHGDMTTSNQNGLVTASVGGASIVTVVPGPVGNPPGGATSGRRSPPYSKITARESLQNMRERGAALEDVTYECVNYEQVKMPDTTANSGQDNRSSLTSELYAEISGTGTGQNSQADPSYGVPTPPPVENLPRQLASMREKDQEAGYAGIRPGRPLSAVSVGSGKGGPEDVANLYSKVDKNRKNRTTIHVSENLQLDPEGGDSAQLYAQVDKTKKSHDQCPSSNREAFGGARPKVKDTKEGKGHSGVNHNSVESASHRDSADPGYMKVQDHNLDAGFNTVSGSGNGIYPINRETIDPDYQMVGDLTGNSNTTTTVTIDPHYSTVRDSIENGSIDNQEIDPNYETVPNVNGMIGSHPGMIHVSSLKVSTNQNWQRREHVYQEIHEAKLDKKFNKANKKQKSDKTQL